MNYRLISISSSQFWKQDRDAKTHTMTFRPDVPEDPMGGASAMMGGDSFVQTATAEEADKYDLGGIYSITVGEAVAEPV